jgi:membrane-associated phospholipid phosphatase
MNYTRCAPWSQGSRGLAPSWCAGTKGVLFATFPKRNNHPNEHSNEHHDMSARIIAFAFLLLTVAWTAEAQSIGKMIGDDFKNAAEDVVGVWMSPFHGSSHDWLLAAGSLGAFGASMTLDQSVSDWAIRNDNSAFFRAIKPVRRGGYLFAGKYVVPPVAVVYVVGLATRNKDLRDFVMGCMSSWGAQSAVRKTVYLLVGRARPDTTPDDPNAWEVPSGGSWNMHSFPAGHFANAVACASYWNNRFHLGAAGPLVYAFAGAVGIGRLADRAHWTSDTVIGGILGYAVGKEVAHRADSRRQKALRTAQLYLSPGLAGTAIGVNFSF